MENHPASFTLEREKTKRNALRANAKKKKEGPCQKKRKEKKKHENLLPPS